jgi:hypothetical protein
VQLLVGQRDSEERPLLLLWWDLQKTRIYVLRIMVCGATKQKNNSGFMDYGRWCSCSSASAIPRRARSCCCGWICAGGGGARESAREDLLGRARLGLKVRGGLVLVLGVQVLGSRYYEVSGLRVRGLGVEM